ncbi:hypothetical protein LVD15_25975 [Fulvivirga maritima]|uniref:hypothetical protein n=1 Tax=Fulvivirga maritima TaxID=2904247 RepID=UPI001F24D35E|nr:hypothetical protein [Fulvivirga maritima]UII26702.1 hypothetical protein LVD15_25975 [Fulvivirga maritima]
MAIEEIKKRFDNLEEIYKTQLEINLKEEDALVAYAGYDFFSLEQFNCEFQNFSRKKIEFFPTLEEVESDEKHIVLIRNGKLLHTRQYFGEDVYYDSVFVHSEKGIMALPCIYKC